MGIQNNGTLLMIRNLSFGELFSPENTNNKKEMKRFFNLCVVLMMSSCVSLYHADYSDNVTLMKSAIDSLRLPDGLSVSFLGSRGSLFTSPRGFYKCKDSVSDTVWFVYVVSARKIPKTGLQIDSICLWTHGILSEAKKSWAHETIEDFQNKRVFYGVIETMEDYGLFSMMVNDREVYVRKLFHEGGYKDYTFSCGR